MGTDRGLHARDRGLHAVHRAVIAAVTARLGPLDGLNAVAVPWHSATFEGLRHTLRFARHGQPARDLAELGLVNCDHVVASVDVEEDALHILTVALF